MEKCYRQRDRFYYGRELFYHREYVEAVDNLLKFLQLPEGLCGKPGGGMQSGSTMLL